MGRAGCPIVVHFGDKQQRKPFTTGVQSNDYVRPKATDRILVWPNEGTYGIDERALPTLVNAAFGYRIRRSNYILEAQVSDQVASRELRTLVERGLLTAEGETRGRTYRASPTLSGLYVKHYERRLTADPFMQGALPFPANTAAGQRNLRKLFVRSGFPDDPRSGLVNVLGRLAGLVGIAQVLLKDSINRTADGHL